MHERRRDPRTSKPYSLANLLKTRAERDGVLLAVVGTPEGFVMGASREGTDRQAQRLAAHASAELFSGAPRPAVVRGAPGWPGLRFLAIKFEAAGRAAFLAAVVDATKAFSLDELLGSVERILNEPPVAAKVAA